MPVILMPLSFTVNLTGVGRVDMSNFELLKVLGTGGEYNFHYLSSV